MTSRMKDTRFVYLPADDDMTDASYKVLGGKKDVEIQCAPYAGGYGVNEYFYDAKGQLEAVQDHGFYRSLEKARVKALEVAGLKP